MTHKCELWGALLIAGCLSGSLAYGSQGNHAVVGDGCVKILATYQRFTTDGTLDWHAHTSDIKKLIVCLKQSSDGYQAKLEDADQKLAVIATQESVLLSTLEGGMNLHNLTLAAAPAATEAFFHKLSQGILTLASNINKNTLMVETIMAALQGHQSEAKESGGH